MSARLEPMAAPEPPVVASPVDAVPRVGDLRFLTRRRGGRRPHWTDIAAYAYLLLGVVLMFGPVLWLVISSFKTQAGLLEFPPNFLPMTQTEVRVPGFDRPLPLFKVTMEDGTVRELAQVRRIGIVATMVDPAAPTEQMRVPIERRVPVRQVAIATSNYTEPLGSFAFGRYLWNSVFVTVVATVITLIINSMAAFALSIYEFPGRKAAMLAVIGTLMIPITVILVPVYLVVTSLGLVNSLWAVILPGAATPTGVFLLRQYMLTLPKDLIEAARMDKASEWQIYWRIVLPLSAPALAVLAIFSVMWRWNDFLWPLAVLTKSESYTLQIGLNAFQGELQVQWHYLLAMTVVTLLPVAVVFAFLQRFIAGGIASTGMK
jgi:alpha-1,4-digalacturonate transport system permease protein